MCIIQQLNIIFNGLAQGAQPLISESYGKGQPTQVRKLLKWSLLVCLAVEALIQLIIWTATDPLISIFNSENNTCYHHTHAVFSYKDGERHCMAAGHMKSITVLYTTEIELRPVTGGTIHRKYDPETGTGFWDFN